MNHWAAFGMVEAYGLRMRKGARARHGAPGYGAPGYGARHRPFIAAVSCLLSLTLFPLPVGLAAPPPVQHPLADSRVIAGVSLPTSFLLGGQRLSIVSCGTRDVLWLPVYVAALYLPGRDLTPLADPTQPKAFSLTVLNDRLLPSRIPDDYRGRLQRALSSDSMASLSRQMARLRTGDQLFLTYAPGFGVHVYVNGAPLAAAPGHAAVDAVLQSWGDNGDWRDKLARTVSAHPC